MNHPSVMEPFIKTYDLLSEAESEVDPAQLTSLATCRSYVIRQAVFDNPNTPPAVRLWLRIGYGEMSLQDFLKAVDSGT